MKSKAVLMALMFAALAYARAQSWPDGSAALSFFSPQTVNQRPDRESERAGREDELYDDGTEALDESQWQKAADKFTAVAEMKGRRADAALYWKAYALSKLGRRGEAQATIAELRRVFPQSRWLKEAAALDLEMKSAAGRPVNPESESDCELKVMALNSLMNSDEERAIPMVENLLRSNSCPKAKDKALFVLSQSDSPRAQAALANIAKGQAHPALQRQAIRNLGLNGTSANKRALVEIYRATADPSIKRAVLHAFLTSDADEETLAVAKTDPDPAMRREAIRQLGAMGAHQQLHQMYQVAATVDDKKAIIEALGISDDVPFLAQIARAPGDLEVRRAALHGLGISGDSAHRPLMEIYSADTNPEIRRAAIDGLFISDGCDELVSLARKEPDAQMKRTLIEKLSLMDCRQARDYMIEILNK